MRNFINMPIDKDYDKPIKSNDAFKSNYFEYENKGDKDKILSIIKSMTKPYLGNIINDHKTQVKWKVHSGNTESNYKSQEEWDIQLTMVINFISAKDSDEICTMRTKSKSDEIFKEILHLFCKNIKKD